VHSSIQQVRNVMFRFPAKISWPSIAILIRKVPSSSQQIPSEVNDFPTAIACSRHLGVTQLPAAIYVPASNYTYSFYQIDTFLAQINPNG